MARRERLFGTVYRRTRVEDGVKIQRAEIRFDGVAGCLRTPEGGSSRQIVVVVDNGRVKSRLMTAKEAARLMGMPEDYALPDRYNEAYQSVGRRRRRAGRRVPARTSAGAAGWRVPARSGRRGVTLPPSARANSHSPPFETSELRKGLAAFLRTPPPFETEVRTIGAFKWGVYAFFDYDGEPIYVGQTLEGLSGLGRSAAACVASRHATTPVAAPTPAVAWGPTIKPPFGDHARGEIAKHRPGTARPQTSATDRARLPAAPQRHSRPP